MIDEHDELIERVARSLRPMPPGDPRAAARIVAAVRRRRARGPRPWMAALEWMREPTLSVASAGMLAAAALAIGFLTRGALAALDDPATLEASRAVSAPLIAAANTPGDVREVPMPITFDAADAKSVSIVGDFNDWDSGASPLTRFGTKGPWTVTVKVSPGRHLYAFMVDGRLVADPRAPRERDLDYGGDASVLMANTP